MTKKEMSYGKIDFVGKIGLFSGISAVLVLASLIYLFVHGLNWGIDFKGGTEMQFKFSSAVAMDDFNKSLSQLNLGPTSVQRFGEGNEFVLRFQGKSGSTDKETNAFLQESIQKIKMQVETTFSAAGPEMRRVDTVGPQVGSELRRSGFLAVFYSLLIILIYVGFRFDYKYAPGAVICLFHDAAITMAIYVFLGKEVNLPILAAILTLIGYSLNDTIVVFDRIRETEHLYHDKSLGFIINKAINDMFVRTLVTSGTTLVSALSLLFLAGGTVGEIALIMVFGIIFGTYSSIYVAAPLIIYFDKFKLMQRVMKTV